VGETSGGLQRHFGLLHATALNITMVVGVGIFVTIPFMLPMLPGPYALLAWVVAGLLVLVDGLIWSELGAALPGSGGSYHYLLEAFGRQRWGRLTAFLFIWQFILSGPLELATGFIAMDTFAQALSPDLRAFNGPRTWSLVLWQEQDLTASMSPVRLGCIAIGVCLIVLLYRRITGLGRLTVTFWLGVLGALAWICVEGWLHFDPAKAFDFSGAAAEWPTDFASNLGGAMLLAMFSYLGYYNICYIGDEVREPGKTIPRAIVLSSGLIIVLFIGTHLALMGTVSWHDVPTDPEKLKEFSLAAEFMRQIHGEWAVQLITILILWSSVGSTFAGLLGYSRIPYGASVNGHFFRAFGRIHPRHRIPHVSLLLVGGLTLLWSFLDLGNVIRALFTTRILSQFVAQTAAVVLIRRTQPYRALPFRLWLYPLPCGLALMGWLYLFVSTGPLFMALGGLTVMAGLVAFFFWARMTESWPFASSGTTDTATTSPPKPEPRGDGAITRDLP
jgi:amino acid transporter